MDRTILDLIEVLFRLERVFERREDPLLAIVQTQLEVFLPQVPDFLAEHPEESQRWAQLEASRHNDGVRSMAQLASLYAALPQQSPFYQAPDHTQTVDFSGVDVGDTSRDRVTVSEAAVPETDQDSPKIDDIEEKKAALWQKISDIHDKQR